MNMKKYGLYIIALAAIAALLCVCLACGLKVKLGQEFSLSVGQSAVIAGENLEITFEEVSEDSRCPEGAVCVQEGRVVCFVKIAEGDSSCRVELAQMGLSDEYSQETYEGYKFTFKIEPYPEVDKEILNSEYHLLLTISR
jgi:hypothetical protein